MNNSEKRSQDVSLKELSLIRKELISLKAYKGVKLAIAVNRNLSLIKSILEPIEKGYEDSINNIEGISTYRKRKMEIVREYGKRDESGELIENINESGQKTISVDFSNKELIEKLEKLEEEFKNVIEESANMQEEYGKSLDKEEAVEFWIISEENAPEDITGDQVEKLVEYGILC